MDSPLIVTKLVVWFVLERMWLKTSYIRWFCCFKWLAHSLLFKHDIMIRYSTAIKGDNTEDSFANSDNEGIEMSENRRPAERRRYSRYKVKHDVFAVFNPHAAVLGQVLDVGKGGLSFSFIDNGNCQLENLGLSLSNLNDGFKIDQIPFKIVSNQPFGSGSSFSSINMRRCCLEFKELTQEQEENLNYFLVHYTTGLVGDRRGMVHRRSGCERRIGATNYNGPERRSNIERRTGEDRRRYIK